MMGVGLATVTLTVEHKKSGDYWDKPVFEEVKVRCIIQVLSSSDEQQYGVIPSSLLRVKVHVSQPESRNVETGDRFDYYGNKYVITSVDDGLMPENMVRFVPFRWTFTAEAVNGRS